MTERITNVIFDWSGVIKDSVLVHLWVVNNIFKQSGAKEITLEELRRNWKQPYMTFYNRYLPGLTIEEEQSNYRRLTTNKDCPAITSYPGITDLIKSLKSRRYFLVVLTSDFPETIFPEIKNYGLNGVFDEVVLEAHNKEAELRRIIDKYHLGKAETMIVGDSNHEIEIGKKCGIRTAAVTWGFSLDSNLAKDKPDYLVHNIGELGKIFEKESSR